MNNGSVAIYQPIDLKVKAIRKMPRKMHIENKTENEKKKQNISICCKLSERQMHTHTHVYTCNQSYE